MPRTPTHPGQPMTSRLTISMRPEHNKKLRKFARRCSMSAATAGRLGIEFLLEVIETGTVPTGYRGTVVYALQEKFQGKRKKAAQTRKGAQS
jgi:hypothetical protein